MARVVFVAGAEWYFLSHRVALARAALRQGHEVVVVAGEERGMGAMIREMGMEFVHLPIARGSTSVVGALRTLYALVRIYNRIRPDLVHHVAIKPVLYGAIAARITRVPAVVNAIAGRGFLRAASGVGSGAMVALVERLLGFAIRRESSVTIFQNPDDRYEFVDRGLVSRRQAVLIRGAGVDLSQFEPTPEAAGVPVVLFASRLLWSKGLGDLVAAARILRGQEVPFRLVVVGVPDAMSPDAVPIKVVEGWVGSGIIEWLGHRSDMSEVMRSASIVCLPTFYGEGIPKVLIEAAATGRPIVCTAEPGCTEVVQSERNGLLVPAHDVPGLAAALKRLLEDADLRARMGRAGRDLAEREFGLERIVEETVEVYRSLIEWDAPSEGAAQQGADGCDSCGSGQRLWWRAFSSAVRNLRVARVGLGGER